MREQAQCEIKTCLNVLLALSSLHQRRQKEEEEEEEEEEEKEEERGRKRGREERKEEGREEERISNMKFSKMDTVTHQHFCVDG